VRIYRTIAAALLLLAVASPLAAQQIVTLPSGKHIKVLGFEKISFAAGGTGLMLKYETNVPIDDTPKLTKEAEEIWGVFRSDVERMNLSIGIIAANEPASGFIVKNNRGYYFIFKRDRGGKWARAKSTSGPRSNTSLERTRER
jgi:hypothetical protein